MTNIALHIGDRIRTVRKSRGLTQEQLGEKVGLPQSYIGNIERGEKNISLETLGKICDALHVTPEALFKNYGTKKTKNRREVEQSIEVLAFSLQSRSHQEVLIIRRLIDDVLRAFDSKL